MRGRHPLPLLEPLTRAMGGGVGELTTTPTTTTANAGALFINCTSEDPRIVGDPRYVYKCAWGGGNAR
eukprot:COSAG01_NODE_5847_length_3998_cov_19.111824_3_plen_68_part_00